MNATRFVRIVLVAMVGFGVVTGLWSFLAPKSFFDTVAPFEPYNRHLFHDIGAFSVGVGVAALLALLGRNGIQVALGAAAAANVLHGISHIVDRDLGGRSSDPWTLSAFAIVTVVAAVLASKLDPQEGPTDATAPTAGRVRAPQGAPQPD